MNRNIGIFCILLSLSAVTVAQVKTNRTATKASVRDSCNQFDNSNLCLNFNRFRVIAYWQTATGSGYGTAVQLTSDTGYFWFFTSNNVELVVKVVNGCGFNSQYWVFAGGLTNVAVTIQVTDTLTGFVNTYQNPPNTAFLPIQDTTAFATCP